MEIFNPKEDIGPNYFITLAGSRAFGKTWAAEHIIQEIHKDPKIGCWDESYLLSMTCAVQKDYFRFIPSDNRISDLNEGCDLVDEIYRSQDERRESGRPMKRILIILDDYINSGRSKSRQLSSLATLARHYNITCFNLVQRISGNILPTVTNNSDILIFFKNISGLEREYLQLNCLTIQSITRKEIWAYYDQAFQKPYQMMVILRREAMKSTTLEGYVKTWVAPSTKATLESLEPKGYHFGIEIDLNLRSTAVLRDTRGHVIDPDIFAPSEYDADDEEEMVSY